MKQREKCSGRGFDSLHLHQKDFHGTMGQLFSSIKFMEL
jgi:hypothetical protein